MGAGRLTTACIVRHQHMHSVCCGLQPKSPRARSIWLYQEVIVPFSIQALAHASSVQQKSIMSAAQILVKAFVMALQPHLLRRLFLRGRSTVSGGAAQHGGHHRREYRRLAGVVLRRIEVRAPFQRIRLSCCGGGRGSGAVSGVRACLPAVFERVSSHPQFMPQLVKRNRFCRIELSSNRLWPEDGGATEVE